VYSGLNSPATLKTLSLPFMIKLSSTKINLLSLVFSLIGGDLLVVNKTSAQLPEFGEQIAYLLAA